ncbi:hypothetical protein [Lignipirellula cremea]|uniref:Uncharacterized protein n=1 Tax=Lignipirellula cremea TaxID=2528010 RepID=A0A518E2C3_9BACT|nr:hypothetical protein [Lignipirellula cremea]QDU98247.1 hypothetical protein Pla8534_61080 [Lignipirellula cremea]
MVKFHGGPYDGKDLEIEICPTSLAPVLRLPEVAEWDFEGDPGATTPRSLPHLYQLDPHADEPQYRYVCDQ